MANQILPCFYFYISNFRVALKYRQGGKVSFSDEEFIKSRSTSLQPFLSEMLQLQIFRQFVDERLELLNAGKGFSDQFELECVSFDPDKFGKKSKSYTAINNVKKEGAAAFKAVKEKANPAVKHAVRSVKDGSKMAKIKVKESYKDAKSRFKDGKEEIRDDGSTHSAPSSPTAARRTSTMPSPNTSFLTRNNTDLNFGRVLKYEKFDPPDRKDLSPEFEEIPKLDYVDLMSSLEEVMNRNKNDSYSRLPAAECSSPVKNISSIIKSSEPVERVGDLISLDSLDTDPVVFDPLFEADKARGCQNQHKKLERAAPVDNVRKYSQGKYENYTPAGGSAQREFKDFMSTMTDPVSNGHRNSEDVKLHEYGIDFSPMNLSRGQNSGVSLMQGQTPPPVPPRSNNNSFLHNNSNHGFPTSKNYMTNIPVNNRISSVNVPEKQSADLFADLDPLRASKPTHPPGSFNSSSGHHQPVSSPFPPPQVPPRTKKQWTTFD